MILMTIRLRAAKSQGADWPQRASPLTTCLLDRRCITAKRLPSCLVAKWRVIRPRQHFRRPATNTLPFAVMGACAHAATGHYSSRTCDPESKSHPDTQPISIKINVRSSSCERPRSYPAQEDIRRSILPAQAGACSSSAIGSVPKNSSRSLAASVTPSV